MQTSAFLSRTSYISDEMADAVHPSLTKLYSVIETAPMGTDFEAWKSQFATLGINTNAMDKEHLLHSLRLWTETDNSDQVTVEIEDTNFHIVPPQGRDERIDNLVKTLQDQGKVSGWCVML